MVSQLVKDVIRIPKRLNWVLTERLSILPT
nr:MAG TPA: hypothetical protein [Caudoviricetes sp.]